MKEILTKPLYAGYIQAPPVWDMPLRKGRHDGLVSFETFEKVQQRLAGGAYAPARADINEDFPLRGAVACVSCGKPLTASRSTSKTGKKHAYYACFAKGCSRCRKSIRREAVEGAFVKLLETLTPAPRLYAIARAMFKDAWQQRLAQTKDAAQGYEREVAKVETQIEVLVGRVVESESPAVIAAYEKRIAELERKKLILVEKRKQSGRTTGSFEELFELALNFLASPSKLSNLGKLEYRKMVLRLTFSDYLSYCPEMGFSNPKTSIPFRMLSDMNAKKNVMAEREAACLKSSMV